MQVGPAFALHPQRSLGSVGEFENGTWSILSIEQTGLDKPCPGGRKLLLQSAFQSCFECLRNSLGHPCTLGSRLWKEWPTPLLLPFLETGIGTCSGNTEAALCILTLTPHPNTHPRTPGQQRQKNGGVCPNSHIRRQWVGTTLTQVQGLQGQKS